MADIAAIVLAAGRASRYRAAGGTEVTKLVADYRGEPLIRWAVRAAIGSKARPVVVVTGHARMEIEAALANFEVQFAHNAGFAAGLASSLRVGVAALPRKVAGAVVLLGDMPGAYAPLIDCLVEHFCAATSAQAAAPLLRGQRGNPVLLGRSLFEQIETLQGDEGARRLLNALAPETIVSVEVEGAAVSWDVDTPADLKIDFADR